MTSQLQQFHDTEFGALEILMMDDIPHFPATECAKILGYKNPHDAIARHCLAGGVIKHEGVSATTNQYGVSTNQAVVKTYISEGNLYRLIVRSKLPAAVRFESWVCDEVLPSIREHGAYISSDLLEASNGIKGFADELFWRLQEERAGLH